jgi:SAM-dependent methyltransferase
MSLYQKILGHALIYDYVRPLAVGGVDLSPSYANLETGPDEVVVDIGCGTGEALRYLPSFREFHGFDTDATAIQVARRRPRARQGRVRFYERPVTGADLAQIRPTRVMMSGLLHHLSDDDARKLLELCAAQESVRRIATNDPVFLERRPINNLYARLDRGRFVREPSAYRAIADAAGLTIVKESVIRSYPVTGLVYYFVMALERRAPPSAAQ